MQSTVIGNMGLNSRGSQSIGRYSSTRRSSVGSAAGLLWTPEQSSVIIRMETDVARDEIVTAN